MCGGRMVVYGPRLQVISGQGFHLGSRGGFPAGSRTPNLCDLRILALGSVCGDRGPLTRRSARDLGLRLRSDQVTG